MNTNVMISRYKDIKLYYYCKNKKLTKALAYEFL